MSVPSGHKRTQTSAQTSISSDAPHSGHFMPKALSRSVIAASVLWRWQRCRNCIDAGVIDISSGDCRHNIFKFSKELIVAVAGAEDEGGVGRVFILGPGHGVA